jgi:hypothetical protein
MFQAYLRDPSVLLEVGDEQYLRQRLGREA